MKAIITSLSIFFIALVSAQANFPTIEVTGLQCFCTSNSINIATAVNITTSGSDMDMLERVVVQISEGYAVGFDVLSLSINPAGLTMDWNEALGELSMIGPATVDDFEAAILAIEFYTSQTVFSANRRFSINLGSANFLPSTGHYYKYISNIGISWAQAKEEAENQTYFGLQGYLATLTSEEEAQLAGAQSPGTGWIGASDAQNESMWQWVTGPESGTTFWQGAASGTPFNGEFSFWNIGEPNNFDGDEDYAHITDPSIGLLGSWNDLPVTGGLDPSSPYHPKGYMIEFGGMPGDPDIRLSDFSELIMPQIEIENQVICSGDEISISLVSNVDEIIWFADETTDTIIQTGPDFSMQLFETTTYWIQAQFNDCPNENRVPLTVTVNPLPIANSITIEQCDDLNSDGVSIFVLNNYNDAVSQGNIEDVFVSYFEDIDLEVPINTISYTNTINNQIVYAKVENAQTGCFLVTDVVLSVTEGHGLRYQLTECEDEERDGITVFNLVDLNSAILEGFPIGTGVHYYHSIEDALLNHSPLDTNYANTTPFEEVIYAKAFNAQACLGLFPVDLRVLDPPDLLENDVVYYCLNQFPETIVLSSGLEDEHFELYQFFWSNGENTPTIQINQPGLFSVEVLNEEGCSSVREIQVLPSSNALVEKIEVSDFSKRNSIVILVTGEGTYEYSIISPYGPYQSSNRFTDVKPGSRTIYIRDVKANCGVVSETIDIIGFPKFFTPNGDGVNDYWELQGISKNIQELAQVTIFNRYGKPIITLDPSRPRWDGTYNGQKLKTNDYWFTAQLKDGRIFKGHFTLKR